MLNESTISVKCRASGLVWVEGGYQNNQCRDVFANRPTVSCNSPSGELSSQHEPQDIKAPLAKDSYIEPSDSKRKAESTLKAQPERATDLKHATLRDRRVRIASEPLPSIRDLSVETLRQEAVGPNRRSYTLPASRQRGFRRPSSTASLSHSSRFNVDARVAVSGGILKPTRTPTVSSASVRSHAHATSKSSDRRVLVDRVAGIVVSLEPDSIPARDQLQYNTLSNLGDLQIAPKKAKRSSTNNLDFECRNDMAAGFQRMSGDARRHPSSNFNRSENRPPMNNVLCRNGPQCRKFQEGTCSYNHNFSEVSANGLNVPKKSLNVESPAFTPNFTPKGANAQPAKMRISPKAAAAAAFTPRGSGAVTPAAGLHSKENSGEFIPQQIFQPSQQFNEFVPGQSFLTQQIEPQSGLQNQLNAFGDPFMGQQGIANLDGQPQLNPYAGQATNVSGQQFYQDDSGYKHPLNYHLYASVGPRRENLMAYQRNTSDFFIPDNLREDLQRKAEATLQTFANSTLPQSVEYFHSLVALDTNNQKGPSTFGYPSWVYKATSSRDGHTYALRRIEGFRLTNESAIRAVQNWKRISNSSLVQVHDAFTGRWFNDSSLIVVTDYHPMAQTLADKHFAVGRHAGANRSTQIIPENELWTYIVELASALKTIHEGGSAAQTVIPSKVLLTSKNRLRLNGCGVLDIVNYEQRRPVAELQRSDLESLGRLILGLATRNQTGYHNIPKALDLVSRSYTERLRACIAWLLTPPVATSDGAQGDSSQLSEYNINTLLNNIADKVVSAFDSTLHLEDELTSQFTRELENGRIVRLLTKLNVVLERPESSSASSAQPSNPNMLNQPSTAWSETGERYYLKLFRDYVFHQVDHDGRAVLDLGHIVTCLNKLDAGIDERIQLVSRDEQNVFIVSYREVKRGFESAWAELSKSNNARR